MHRIPYFRIRPDPDPTGSITVGSSRIRIFTGSGSGCNLIRIKAELQPIVCCHCLSKHRIIKDNRQDKFLICCDAAPFLTYNLSLVCCLALVLHGNESGWPDPDCLDPTGSGFCRILIFLYPAGSGSWKNTGYPAGSGSGAPLVFYGQLQRIHTNTAWHTHRVHTEHWKCLSMTFRDLLCAFTRMFQEYLYQFSMTFQDCLIKWLFNKADLHLLSAAERPGGALKLPSRCGLSPATRQVLVYTDQKCGNHLTFQDM